MQLDGLNSPLTPIVYGDNGLSIKNKYTNTPQAQTIVYVNRSCTPSVS